MKELALYLLLTLVLSGPAQSQSPAGQKSSPPKQATKSEDDSEGSVALRPEEVNAVNEMSRAVGGRTVLGLSAPAFPSGREVQMTVMDDSGQRWILGVSHTTAKPTTKLCFSRQGWLAIVNSTTEPKYGMLNGQPLSAAAGEAINAELAAISKEHGGTARIKAVAAFAPPKTFFVVSWELEVRPDQTKGQFAIGSDGKKTALPKNSGKLQ